MSNGRKRNAADPVEDLFEMDTDNGSGGSEDQMETSDKRHKISEQDQFEQSLQKAMNCKIRSMIIRGFVGNKIVQLSEQHFAELLFDHIVALDYHEVQKLHKQIPDEIVNGEIIQNVMHLANHIESIAPASRGFGQRGGGFGSSEGFGSSAELGSSAGFGSGSYDSGFGHDFSSSPGWGSPYIPGGVFADITQSGSHGFTDSPAPRKMNEKQKAIADALCAFYNAKEKKLFSDTILMSYVDETIKRLTAMQLKEITGSSILTTDEFANLVGYASYEPAKSLIQEIVNLTGWEMHGYGISATTGLRESVLDKMINNVEYSHIRI